MRTRRVTQKDIADKAGVSRSTVTFSLKGDPKIPDRTRKRIERIARELGYVPDPMLSCLANYRSSKRSSSYHGVLAWFVYEPVTYNWRNSHHYCSYLKGAQERALHLGYVIDEFYYNPAKQSVAGAVSVLRSRGIRGLLLCPLPSTRNVLQFPLDHFSAVALGYNMHKPLLNRVASAHFNNTRNILLRLRKKGYRRIGLILDQHTDTRCNYTVSSCFLGEQAAQSGHEGAAIPILFESMTARSNQRAYEQRISDYAARHNLDCILTEDAQVLARAAGAGLDVPRQIGIATINLLDASSGLAGIVEPSEQIGAHAVDLLASMIQRGESGVPPYPVSLQVEGFWVEGRSLAARKKSATGKIRKKPAG